MNYQPVTTANQSNPIVGVQEQFDAEKARDDNVQQYVLFPLWSFSPTNPQNTDDDTAFGGEKHEFKERKPESEVHVSPSRKFEDFSDNSINEVNVVDSPILIVGQISTNITNTFSVVGPSNNVVSPTHGKSSYVDTSQYPDDPNMLELEDITYSDDAENVGAEADFTNLETTITEELLQFKMQKVWVLVDLPHGKRAIGTKWVFRNKKDERGIVVRNKARLVAQGHTQEESINYEEVFAPVARIEAIRLFLAYASFMGFMVYQMDVKSAFLYGTIEEEVYVYQPPGFEDPDYPDKGKIDHTLFIKRQKGDILLVQIYVDDIIFGSTNKDLCKVFEKSMKDKFQMSLMGELTFFLGLQDPDGEDVDVDVHTYRSMIGSLMYLTSSRQGIMFAGKPHLGLWYPKDSPFNLVAYSDSDYAGASLDRKSTTGGCQFLGCRLISWQCKKQTVVATSFTKAKYVAAASCCAQVLWIQNQLLDYG
nr:hypothetical protein [Tanacetum cinerariifolium]